MLLAQLGECTATVNPGSGANTTMVDTETHRTHVIEHRSFDCCLEEASTVAIGVHMPHVPKWVVFPVYN
jgi:activator of HSP90 ATPase